MPNSNDKRPRTAFDQPRLLVLGGVWVITLAAGLGSLIAYGYTPTEEEQTPPVVQPAGGEWRLTLGVHPRCPCTHATVSELERLLTHSDGLRCLAYIYTPTDQSTFTDTVLVKRLRALPGCLVAADPDGDRLSQLGIVTSGGCVLYDGLGVLQFSGGITHSRGHEGFSLGTQAISALLAGRAPEVRRTPVYGCRIVAPAGDDT